ncbi:MAG: YceI family protein [Armatimonadetes bacterium]|nr:YceI family protein [Armatimonadota bacterium]
MKRFSVLLAVLALLSLVSLAYAEEFEIDPNHSSVIFKVKHLGISTVTGRFEKFSGSFSYNPKNVKASKGTVTIDAASINTNVGRRDDHLRSADFFDVEKHPEIKFVSRKVYDLKKGKFRVLGDLTLHGVTRPATLDVETGGMIKDPQGGLRAAFTATTAINRKDYGLTWNRVIEAGKLTVGEQVRIILEIEAAQKKS